MNNLWSKLAPRERLLAVGVAAALVFMLVMTTVVRSARNLAELDDSIAAQEAELQKCTRLEAQSTNVQQAYEVVAQQHSSEWTESEIHNRLRAEIYRLARKDPNAPAETQQPNLVEFPGLKNGELHNSGHGYREYRLRVDIPQTDLPSLIEFMTRLQSSPQSLRIDGLEIGRAPMVTVINAKLDVTRIVVDGVKTNAEEVKAAPQKVETWDGSTMDLWQADGCTIALAPDILGVTAPGGCLAATATAAGGTFRMVIDVNEPGTYEAEIEATATGPAKMQVRNEVDGQLFEGSTDMAGDSVGYKYRLRFAVTGGGESEPVRVAVPYVTVADAGTRVFVDLVTLRKVR